LPSPGRVSDSLCFFGRCLVWLPAAIAGRGRRARRGGSGVGRCRDGQDSPTNSGEPEREDGRGTGDTGFDHLSSFLGATGVAGREKNRGRSSTEPQCRWAPVLLDEAPGGPQRVRSPVCRMSTTDRHANRDLPTGPLQLPSRALPPHANGTEYDGTEYAALPVEAEHVRESHCATLILTCSLTTTYFNLQPHYVSRSARQFQRTNGPRRLPRTRV
jgi:hypothetical protein